MSVPLLLLCATACPAGEYTVRECTATSPTVCWPCEAGYACANGSKTACRVGAEWSSAGMAGCSACSGVCAPGWMLVGRCDDGTSDRVCVRCPGGFGCEQDIMRRCAPGTFSDGGVCVACGENQTTKRAGAVASSECVCVNGGGGNCTSACLEGQFAVGGECRGCPSGFGCDSGTLRQCDPDTFSSSSGVCVQCGPSSHSAAGAGSADECVCDEGFSRDEGGLCAPCRPGTVYRSSGGCLPCTAGFYCLGRMHHEPCPGDAFSHPGSALCSACRMNSGCVAHGANRMCVAQENCTCDDGFVDHGGECRRCPASTMKPRRHDGVGCAPCPRGMECLGGAEVRSCGLATFSGGNRTKCAVCSACREITVARCNATHDSVCEATPFALAIVTLMQYYHTQASGDTFAMFALVLASSIPKAQLVRVCSAADACVRCFQGQCPMAIMKRLKWSRSYELEIEIRSDAVRLASNVESLTQSAFLPGLAKTAMAKLTDLPFTLRSHIEHTVLCPAEAGWDGSECIVQPRSNVARTWLGLGVSIVLLALIALWRGRVKWDEENNKSKISWARVEEVTDSD
jgi:hypothetical protein